VTVAGLTEFGGLDHLHHLERRHLGTAFAHPHHVPTFAQGSCAVVPAMAANTTVAPVHLICRWGVRSAVRCVPLPQQGYGDDRGCTAQGAQCAYGIGLGLLGEAAGGGEPEAVGDLGAETERLDPVKDGMGEVIGTPRGAVPEGKGAAQIECLTDRVPAGAG